MPVCSWACLVCILLDSLLASASSLLSSHPVTYSICQTELHPVLSTEDTKTDKEWSLPSRRHINKNLIWWDQSCFNGTAGGKKRKSMLQSYLRKFMASHLHRAWCMYLTYAVYFIFPGRLAHDLQLLLVYWLLSLALISTSLKIRKTLSYTAIFFPLSSDF